jgi:hypothetical protein
MRSRYARAAPLVALVLLGPYAGDGSFPNEVSLAAGCVCGDPYPLVIIKTVQFRHSPGLKPTNSS